MPFISLFSFFALPGSFLGSNKVIINLTQQANHSTSHAEIISKRASEPWDSVRFYIAVLFAKPPGCRVHNVRANKEEKKKVIFRRRMAQGAKGFPASTHDRRRGKARQLERLQIIACQEWVINKQRNQEDNKRAKRNLSLLLSKRSLARSLATSVPEVSVAQMRWSYISGEMIYNVCWKRKIIILALMATAQERTNGSHPISIQANLTQTKSAQTASEIFFPSLHLHLSLLA